MENLPFGFICGTYKTRHGRDIGVVELTFYWRILCSVYAWDRTFVKLFAEGFDQFCYTNSRSLLSKRM